MKTLAVITFGQSRYDDRLRTLLDESGIDPEEFEDLEYFGLLPFFVLAGASVRTDAHAHGDHMHFQGVTVELPEELEESFFTLLPEMLEQAYGEDEGDDD
ncbi:MAG TPA: hypothetical protein VLA98_04620 [Solirubrobacteraceae bacterium]|nr:hypothetical protein [Solirubrobacteraceae bacterium]